GSSRAALAERRHFGVRGMAHGADAGNRRAAGAAASVEGRSTAADRRPGFRIHTPELSGADSSVVYAGGPRLPVHRTALGFRAARVVAPPVHERRNDGAGCTSRVGDRASRIRPRVRRFLTRAFYTRARRVGGLAGRLPSG